MRGSPGIYNATNVVRYRWPSGAGPASIRPLEGLALKRLFVRHRRRRGFVGTAEDDDGRSHCLLLALRTCLSPRSAAACTRSASWLSARAGHTMDSSPGTSILLEYMFRLCLSPVVDGVRCIRLWTRYMPDHLDPSKLSRFRSSRISPRLVVWPGSAPHRGDRGDSWEDALSTRRSLKSLHVSLFLLLWNYDQ